MMASQKRRFRMGIMRRRMRRRAIVGGAAAAAVAYHAGKSRGEAEYEDAATEPDPPQSYAPPPPAQSVPDRDPVDELRRLGELHTQGILTDEEFATAKAKVIGS
jgi:hypothetical protein